MLKRIAAAAAAAALIPGAAAALIPGAAAAGADTRTRAAAGETLLFDFGAEPAEGWICAGADTKYDKYAGYGFSMISYVENAEAPGSGALSDGVKIKKRLCGKTTFDVDLEPGMYEVSVYSGDISYMSVSLEGHRAILDISESASEARAEIAVTDGQLNLGLCPSVSGTEYAIAAMTIQRTGGLDERRRRIFICGDSTAASYCPMFAASDSGFRGGWGQMLGAYTDCRVHNFASGGQTAKGFSDGGFLDDMLCFAEPGDFVMMSFGINDKGSRSPEEFKSDLGVIADAAKKKGCVPIVLSDIPTLYDFDENGKFTGADECYAEQSRQFAEERGIKFIDLHAAAAKYFEAIGTELSEALHWTQWSGVLDRVHLNRMGAGQIARLVAERCGDIGIAAERGYGISPDLRLKCSAYKNTVYLENMTSEPLALTLVATSYISGGLSRVKTTPIALPAYDPQSPGAGLTEVYAPLYVLSNHIYVMGEGICVSPEWNTR